MRKDLEKLSDQVYDRHYVRRCRPKPTVGKNCLRAFFVGGLICALGEGIKQLIMYYTEMDAQAAAGPASAVLIILAVLATGFGVFDKLAQWAGAGTAVPITGFANSIASAAIEHRSEGYVLGVGGNMFRLAGSVIAFGVFSAFVVALIRIAVQALLGVSG